ncbi:MAG: FG-GAP repeat protein [Sandaracinus sp.]|nr:FG-GAP repeat protein [Sandaracinus sp.]
MPQGETARFVAWVLVCVSWSIGCNPEQRIEESQLKDFGRFGRSVAMHSAAAAVGAAEEDSGSGAVYVFARGGDVLSPMARLVSPGASYERFGDAVALDGTTLVVGAPRSNRSGAVRAGAAYVFEYAAGAWSHTATLESAWPHEAWEGFGTAVAVSGDRIVVGAPDRDVAGKTDAGAAFVFTRSGGVWSYAATLTIGSPGASDKLGASVAVAGDTIVVGAPRRDVFVGLGGTYTDAGAAYVFGPSGSSYAWQQTLVAPDRRAGDLFGVRVAATSATDVRRVLVGASGADLGRGANAGAAYVFAAAPSVAFPAGSKLVAGTPATNAGFGGAVALSTTTLAVGASGTHGSVLFAGAAHVFRLDGATWVEEATLVDESPDASAFLGSAVAIVGEVVIAGATGEELGPNRTDTGVVQVFRGPGGVWSRSHALHAATSPTNANYGRVLAVSEESLVSGTASGLDLARRDADAWSIGERITPPTGRLFEAAAVEGDTLVTFAKQGTAPVGRLEVRTFDGAHWVLTQTIDPDLVSVALPSESANSARLAIAGDVFVLGAPRFNGGDGRIFVYRRSAGSWSLAQTIDAPTASSNFDMNFGREVALSGDVLVVAEVPSSGIPSSATHGRVHVYRELGGSFLASQIFTAASPTNLDHFGESVAVDGALLAIVAPAADEVQVYRRIGDDFVLASAWASPTDLTTSARHPVDVVGDLLAVGLHTFDYDSFVDAGEVRLLRLLPDDSFDEENVFRANAATTNLGLGSEVRLTSDRVVASARPALTSMPGRVYAFPR